MDDCVADQVILDEGEDAVSVWRSYILSADKRVDIVRQQSDKKSKRISKNLDVLKRIYYKNP